MFEDPKKLQKSRSTPILPILGVVALLSAAGFGYVRWLESQPGPEEAVLTEEAKAYLPSLKLRDVTMSAKDDALGQTLVEINGTVANNGDRVVEVAEINCIFREVNGIEIGRQLAQVVRRRDGPLMPGETRGFRLPFDDIPYGWNQNLPSLYIAQIQFED